MPILALHWFGDLTPLWPPKPIVLKGWVFFGGWARQCREWGRVWEGYRALIRRITPSDIQQQRWKHRIAKTLLSQYVLGLWGPLQTMIGCPEIKQKPAQHRKIPFETVSLPLASHWEEVRAPPSFCKVPRLPRKFPELPRRFFSDFPGSFLSVVPKSNPEVPQKFPRLPGSFPDFPGGQPLSMGSLTPSPDPQKHSLKDPVLSRDRRQLSPDLLRRTVSRDCEDPGDWLKKHPYSNFSPFPTQCQGFRKFKQVELQELTIYRNFYCSWRGHPCRASW